MKRVAPLAAMTMLAALGALSATPALAAIDTTITFEGVESFSSVGDYYASQGISFSGGALALMNDGTGSGVNGEFFTNAPSATVMFTADDVTTMNVLQGFTGAVAFAYSSGAALTSAVTIYSGLNGTGSVLGTFSLLNNATSGCSDSDYCHWDQISLAFAGVAKSLSFTGTQAAAFDNINVSAVPEPQTYAMMALGLVALLAQRRRQRRD